MPLSKTISLNSGGQITISFSGNMFTISKADREFVYGLLDAMTAYEEKLNAPKEDLSATGG
jgi:antitoxin component of MazEF toxin-antitoxin module